MAVAEGGLRGEVRDYGRIANTPAALDRLMRKLGGEGVRLRVCYEAGPCGYGIQRHVSARGHECVVVAPSLIPRRCATWCAPVWMRCMRCVEPASSFQVSYCARAATTGGRLGPSCIAAGSRGSSSSKRCIILCRGLHRGDRSR